MKREISAKKLQEIKDEWSGALKNERRAWLTYWELNQLGVVVIDRPTHGGSSSRLTEAN
jgi:hypothetical protein